jgi:hypothetical protein
MSEEEIANLKMIRDVVDNPLFNSLISNMKRAIADTMLVTKSEEDRDRLFSEAQAIDRLVGELVKTANKYRMTVDV